jgi:plastocyanin domain-containing protein
LKKFIFLFAMAASLGIPAIGSAKEAPRVIQLRVTEKGFEPNHIDVKPGTMVTLNITRETDSTCATAIQIPSKKIRKDLPLNKSVQIDLGKVQKGEIRFACGMDMVSGVIAVQ